MVSHQKASLSYGARREVLAQIAPRYQQATGVQKMLLLDRCVELTGYGRKYVITLLNHVPESTSRILRPRLPIYGSAVQCALCGLADHPVSVCAASGSLFARADSCPGARRTPPTR